MTRNVTYDTLETRDTLLKGVARMNTIPDKKFKHFAGLLEDILMTVTYAEADDLKDVWNTLGNDMKSACPDECQYGDSERCGNES